MTRFWIWLLIAFIGCFLALFTFIPWALVGHASAFSGLALFVQKYFGEEA